MKHRGWITLSGYMWLFMGIFLLYKGLNFISQATLLPNTLCSRFQDPQQAGTLFIAAGLLVGFLKGRFVLSKSVKRVVTRIASLPLPIRMKDAYARSYWFLIGGMMMLGMVFRFLPIPIDARGIIDVAIGSALINGAMLYFRAAKATYGTDSLSQSP